MSGAGLVAPLAGRAGAGAELLIVEGVMGLFDGAAEDASGSTAHVARLLDAPVILVVDAAAMSSSVAAMVHGYSTYDPTVRVAGVVLNRVGSDGHEVLLREALAPLGVPVLGALRRDDAWSWRDRHLGLVPVAEQPDAVRRSLAALAAAIERAVDLDAVMRLAATAPPMHAAELPAPRPLRVGAARPRIAVAGGPAFSFVYADNLEAMEAAGAELVPFDPLRDPALPSGATALYAGGGFPEVFAAGLADNRPLLDDVRARAAAGLVMWAECGGLLWLSRSLDESKLAGVIEADATMTDRLTLGYRRAVTAVVNPVLVPGEEVRGHEFHYSTIEPAGDAVDLRGRFGQGRAGFATPTMLATYLHVHLAANPAIAERFVAAASRSPAP
jgi:cobyrinic acid a,c-diamide synthase